MIFNVKHTLGIIAIFAIVSVVGSPVQIEYFYQPGCKECQSVTSLIIPRLEDQFSGKYTIKYYDISNRDNYIILAGYQEKFNITDNVSVSMVLNGHVYLGGYPKIEKDLFDAIRRMSDDKGGKLPPASKDVLHRRSTAFSLGTIALAGLIDGFNPCVFATLVFFLSLLATYHVADKKLLLIGVVYCFSCFLTYLLLGLGLLQGLRPLQEHPLPKLILETALIVALVVFSVLSFRDAWAFHRSQQPASVMLQLPDSIKKHIHTIMRKGVRYRYLLPGIFFIGVAVTLLESVCSGQIYVPTLVFMTRECGIASKYWWYLLLYNLMFIAPLILLFIAFYCGIAVQQLISWSKRDVVYAKIAMGVFFLFMAVIMIYFYI